MKKIYSVSVLILTAFCATAQLFVVNTGTIISVTSGGVVYIDGSYVDTTQTAVAPGLNYTIQNKGEILLTENWTNYSKFKIFASEAEVSGVKNGWVRMIGDSQTISGDTLTYFNNLGLYKPTSGSGTAAKNLVEVMAQVEDTLALTDREFNVGKDTVVMLSSGIDVVTRTADPGFVSCIENGGISRNTVAGQKYLFPVGSRTGTQRYRQVEITPAAADTFHVGMHNYNATTDLYDVNKFDSLLCKVNDQFYHRIDHWTIKSTSKTADVTIYYNPVTDGTFEAIAHWDSVKTAADTKWNTTKNNVASTPSASITSQAWNDFNPNPFALAKQFPKGDLISDTVCSGNLITFKSTKGFGTYEYFLNNSTASVQKGADSIFASNALTRGDTLIVRFQDIPECKGTDTLIVHYYPDPNVSAINPTLKPSGIKDTTIILGEFAPLEATGADMYVWEPGNLIGSSVSVSPEDSTWYLVFGTDINKCVGVDSVFVRIDRSCVHWLPNIFSPNADGINDEFTLMHKGLDKYKISVFDRWGNNVFNSDDKTKNWDGTFNGDIMNNSVFVYFMSGKCFNSEEEFEQHGNVTITR